MTAALGLHFRGTVERRSDASSHLKSSGDAVLVERGRPRMLLLSCPCGCGEEFPINLDPRSGPAWRLYGTAEKGLSLYPSVWRDSGCKSHYIIWRGRILLFGQGEDDIGSSLLPEEVKSLSDKVRRELPARGLSTISTIADAVDGIPWDVLMVCRRLVREGVAREGSGKNRGSFGVR